MSRFKGKGFWELFFMIWMGIVPLSSSLILGYVGFNKLDTIRDLSISGYFYFWMAAIFILGLGFFPTTFFALFCGYIWGIKAILPIYLTYLFASLLGFGLARLLKGGAILQFLQSKPAINAVLGNVQKNSIYWVFLVRLSPIFPFAITNTLLAYVKVNLKSFIIGGSLGMMPRSIFALWVGSQAATWELLIQNPDKINSQNIVSLLFLIVSGLGMFYLIRKNSLTARNP